MTKLFKVGKYEKGSTEVVFFFFLLILQVFYQLKIILKGNIFKSEL